MPVTKPNKGVSAREMPRSPRISIYRWRAPMLASLAHRASGLMLVLFSLFFLCLLQAVYAPEAAFTTLVQWMHSWLGQTFLLFAGASLIYHLFNGLRFIMLDLGVGESRQAMRGSAKASIAVGLAALFIMGAWL